MILPTPQPVQPTRTRPTPRQGAARPFVWLACAAALGFVPGASGASPGIPGYAVVPLASLHKTNAALVRIKVDGQSTLLALDTGASTSLLDSAFYKGTRSKSTSLAQNELPADLPRQTTGNGLKADVGYVSLQAGGADFGKGPVSVMDLSGLFGTYNHYHSQDAITGLLGEDVLRRYAAIIDWRRRGIYFNLDASKRMKTWAGN